MSDDLSELLQRIAARASVLTGVHPDEIRRELEPSPQPAGGWLIRFTGPSFEVREAVEQAIAELRP